MLRKYSIHDEKKGIEDAVAYLYYDEETKKYSLEVVEREIYPGLPAILICAIQLGKYYFDDEIARLYVKEHVIPPDRAGMDYILKELSFPYYDEIFFLDKFRGRSVMDEYLIDRVE